MEAKQRRKDGGAGEYVPLPLIGQIREKGFSSNEQSNHRVSLPEPRITPFPVARHRSEGPHWKSLSTQSTNSADEARDVQEDLEDKIYEQIAFKSESLLKRKKKVIDISKRKSGKEPRKSSDVGMDSNNEPVTSGRADIFTSQPDEQENQAFEMRSLESSLPQDRSVLATEELSSTNSDSNFKTATNLQRTEVPGSSSGTLVGVSSMNECILQSMTNEQIVKAQQELKDRFRPDILEMLRRRGKEKGDKQSTKDDGLDNFMAEASDLNSKFEDGGQQVEQGISSAEQMSLGSQSQWQGKCWTDRIEAVRAFRFGLDGHFVAANSKSLLTTSEADNNCNEERIPNVNERDFLRMDGDPSLYGYTIKEAVALARSMVPAQRSAALRLICNILSNAMLSLQQNDGESFEISSNTFHIVDWPAVWAYALGPEPELVLTLRIALDDSHATAVVTSARALECLLSCSENEHYFKLCESLLPNEYSTFTAPVFKKSFFDESGVLGDCFWKYNVKPRDMYPASKGSQAEVDDTDETVKDDAFIANQDVAAGLIRMGILPRIRYLLEVERLTAAEESLFSILIALSRHSPAAADAVMKCPRLMNSIHELFVLDKTRTWSARHKAIKLLKVLSIAKKSNCVQLLNLGMFESSQLGLVHHGLTSGTSKRAQEESSFTELIEALHFWRVCVKYGLCISCYPDYYASLLFWIATPSFQFLQEKYNERDVYLAEASFRLLETLADTLPILQYGEEPDQSMPELSDSWSWSFAIPIVDNSLGWLSSDFVQICMQVVELADSYESPHMDAKMFLRILSSVLHFLSTVCDKIMKEGDAKSTWLPTFVPKVCLQMIHSGILCFDGTGGSDSSCFSISNRFVKQKVPEDYRLDVLNFLFGIIRLLKSLDRLLLSAKDKQLREACGMNDSGAVQKVLQCGLVMPVKQELLELLKEMGDDFLLNASSVMNFIDNPRRGGPAPGLGMGWGCKGGGYWSHQVLATQGKLVLLQELLSLLSSKGVLSEGLSSADEILSSSDGLSAHWRLKLSLSMLNLAGPHHRDLVERLWHDFIFRESLLTSCITRTGFLVKQWLQKIAPNMNSQEVENVLTSRSHNVPEIKHSVIQHFQSMWLSQKMKHLSKNDEDRSRTLTTVPEEAIIFCASSKESLAVQWAGQKLPLPPFWFLSPLLIGNGFASDHPDREGIVRNGIILLHVLESCTKSVRVYIPIAIIIHALSTIFVMSDDFFLERDVNCMIGALQEMYMYELDCGPPDSQSLDDIDMTDETMSGKFTNKDMEHKLDFEGLIDERYPSFLDKLMSQFASVSYGDLVFSRQVAIYLRKDVSASLRLRVWKSLESEHMFEFLPPLEQCCGSSTSYVYPIEDAQDLLKALSSSLSSGALDRARGRQSVSFSLAAFHVAPNIFQGR